MPAMAHNPKSSVSFADSEPQALAAHSRLVVVNDDEQVVTSICALTAELGLQAKQCVYRLGQRPGVHLSVDAASQDFLKSGNAYTLESILDRTSTKFSRLEMGLRFALTLLSVATTPWLPKSLNRDMIVVLSKEGSQPWNRWSGPYIAHKGHPSRLMTEPTSPLWYAKDTLLLLGVILLELFYGEALEQQSVWDESTANGEANDSTVFLSAFLWCCRAKDDLKKYFGSDLGGELQEAIRKCICYEFGTPDSMGDSKLVETVYREVVVPLEKCCPQLVV
jgi:hypothetical protein